MEYLTSSSSNSQAHLRDAQMFVFSPLCSQELFCGKWFNLLKQTAKHVHPVSYINEGMKSGQRGRKRNCSMKHARGKFMGGLTDVSCITHVLSTKHQHILGVEREQQFFEDM